MSEPHAIQTGDARAVRAAGAGRVPLTGGSALVVRGAPGATPILFLHGLAGAAWSWAAQAAALADGRRTYAWEARGHGDAAPAANMGLGDLYDDAKAALDFVTRSEGRSAIVAGHSLGGLLALALAADRPGDVAGLFLVEPTYVASASSLFPAVPQAVLAPVLVPFVFALAEGFRFGTFAARAYARLVFDFSFYDRTRLEAAWRMQRRQRPLEYRKLLLEFAGAPSRFRVREFAKEIALPVHLVEATGLGLGTHFPKLGKQLRRLGPDFTRRVIRGGHYLQLDRDEAVTTALTEFVATVDERR